MTGHVIDTNVLLVASAAEPYSPFDDSHVPPTEQLAVLDWLAAFRADESREIVIDDLIENLGSTPTLPVAEALGSDPGSGTGPCRPTRNAMKTRMSRTPTEPSSTMPRSPLVRLRAWALRRSSVVGGAGVHAFGRGRGGSSPGGGPSGSTTGS